MLDYQPRPRSSSILADLPALLFIGLLGSTVMGLGMLAIPLIVNGIVMLVHVLRS